MDLGIKGKVAIVTGASRGIGRAIALELAKEGAHVVVAGIDQYYDYYRTETRGKDIKTEELEAVSRQIQGLGVQSIAIKADISKKEDIENIVGKTIDKFGRIDICVNNAGVAIPEPFDTVTEEDWNLHYEVILMGTWHMCKAVIPIMKKQGGGRIISISSISGKVPWPFLTCYNTSKAGLIGLTKSLADEYSQYGITFNCVLPGITETKLADACVELFSKHLGITEEQFKPSIIAAIPTRRWSTPEDMAYTVCFLASDKAGQLTGQSLNVAGGQIKD